MKFAAKITMTSLLGLLAFLLVGLFSPGCTSLGKPASASFASVTLRGKTPQQIQEATLAVFHENGFQGSASGPTLVFEREGSRANSIARDGLVRSHYGAVTIIRVRVQLVELGADSHRLQCQAYMVSDAGDAFMQTEHRLANFRSGPYQKLLDDVAKRLQ